MYSNCVLNLKTRQKQVTIWVPWFFCGLLSNTKRLRHASQRQIDEEEIFKLLATHTK